MAQQEESRAPDEPEPIALAAIQRADLAFGGIIGGKPKMVAHRPVRIIAATAFRWVPE
jgi:hypothetical protein